MGRGATRSESNAANNIAFTFLSPPPKEKKGTRLDGDNVVNGENTRFIRTGGYGRGIAGFGRDRGSGFAQRASPSRGAKTWRARFALNHDEHPA